MGVNVNAQIAENTKQIHVFLLMGQSNMAGYGHVTEEDKQLKENILKIPTITSPPYVWVSASHPLHNRLKTDKFGLGIPFAEKYLKNHSGVNVGLLPLAWGGAGIDRLNKLTKPYEDAMEKVRAITKDSTVIIKGVLWHQGENDTVNDGLADSYERKLHQLITDIREDIGDEQLIFIVGDLAEFYGTYKDHSEPQRIVNINKVRKVLKSLPSKIPYCGYVGTEGCTSHDFNNVHFDRTSYMILGNRYADVFEQMSHE